MLDWTSMKPIKASRPRFLRGTFASGILQKERKREKERGKFRVEKWKWNPLSLSLSLFISHSLFQTGGSSNLGSLIRESTAKLLDQFVMLQAVINWISMEKRCGLFSVGTVERVEANDENFSKLIDKVWGRRQFNFWRGKCLFMWPFKDAFESKMRCCCWKYLWDECW